MIQKIKTNEYLTGYEGMGTEERKDYRGRVGEWLRSGGRRMMGMTDRPMAKAQNIVQLSTRWSADDCRAFQDGARLLSALVDVADTWLPTQLYARSAYRAVRQMVKVLYDAQGETGGKPKDALKFIKTSETADTVVYQYVEKGDGPNSAPSSTGAKSTNGQKPVLGTQVAVKVVTPEKTAAVPQSTKPQGTLPAGEAADTAASGAVPVRPKHIDQYVHLLPESTQKKAAAVQGLLRELDQARENMRLLMNDAHASGSDRAKWASAADTIDKKLKAIYKELDREWAKLVAEGRVVVDDLGMARVVEPAGEAADTAAGTAAGEEAPLLTPELTSDQKHRRRELRKWLIDTRRGAEGKAREKRIEQWHVNIREYLTLEPREAALKDEKLVEAAKHFGIDLAQF